LQSTFSSVFDIPVTTIEGKSYKKLSDLVPKKKAYLFVNVASKWGLTDRDYKQLVQIHKDWKDKGLEILAFPCNQFMGQEPGSA